MRILPTLLRGGWILERGRKEKSGDIIFLGAVC